MKVLYFHQHFNTPRGRVGIRSYQMAKALVSSGHSVTMVCGSYQGGDTGLTGQFSGGVREGQTEGIHVIELDLGYSNRSNFWERTTKFLKFAIKSVGIALTRKADLVFATTTPLTAGIPGIVARWLLGRKFVFEVRDLWPELPREMGVITNRWVLRAMGALEWVSYRSAHRLVGLSPGIVDGIARRGVPRERIAMIPNGCDLDLFGGEGVVPWRPEGVGEGELMAVFTGTHGIANGLDAVLDAAAELKRRPTSGIRLVLIGDGRLKPELQERAEREGLEAVLFLDPVPKTELAGLLAAADLGLQILANVPAFYYGTSPNKFFDFLAAGLPVLNNYPGWLADLIEENDCGFAVAPENPAAFADALERASGDWEGLREKGKRARALAEREFAREKLFDRFYEGLFCEKQSHLAPC